MNCCSNVHGWQFQWFQLGDYLELAFLQKKVACLSHIKCMHPVMVDILPVPFHDSLEIAIKHTLGTPEMSQQIILFE
jgi:hypothetical protein